MKASDDDKPDKPKSPATPESDDVTQFAPRKRTPADDERRRIAAARAEIEKKRALAAASAAADKTQFRPRSRPASTPPAPEADDDKTQFKATPRRPAPAPASEDKTRFRTPTSKPQGAADPDRTRFKPGDDRTRIAKAKTGVRFLEEETEDEFEELKTLFPKPAVEEDLDYIDLDEGSERVLDEGPDAAHEVQVEVIHDVSVDEPVETYVDAPDASGQAPQTLKRRFVLEEILGVGGMGVVYKARDLLKVEAKDRDPYVAIKVLSEEFKSHPEAFVALQRESRKTQRIAHPNIVNVHDFDRDGETVFMTMEFLDGKPLDKLLKQYRSTGLPTEEAWEVVKGICSALAYAHAQNIIHSDFKPGNIFVSKNGVAKVFDFGIARAVSKAEVFADAEGGADEDRTVFDAGDLGALTPAYASFEMLNGEEPDPRDDVYALGCVVYEVFGGEHPFNKMRADKAFAKKLKPKRINSLSKHQWRVLEKALAFERDKRVPSVEAFLREITRVRKTPYLTIGVFALLFGGGAAVFLLTPNPELQQVDVAKLQADAATEAVINVTKERVDSLLQEESASLTEEWEVQVLQDVKYLRQYFESDDPWMKQTEQRIANLYMNKVSALREAGEFNEALALLERALKLDIGSDVFKSEADSINSQIAANAKQQRDQIEAGKSAAQARARAAAIVGAQKDLRTQLSCKITSGTQHYGVDLAKLGKAISRLKGLSASAYKHDESNYAGQMVACIQNIATEDPERASAVKSKAAGLFPGNRTQISAIRIVPKDPCTTSLAGRGGSNSRAYCRDDLAVGGTGPRLVVVPSGRGHPYFAIGKYEVSVSEFNQFCKKTHSCGALGGDSSAPATGISFSMAKKYVQWLSKQSERDYRIPSESEWKYAARATGTGPDPNRNCTLVLPNLRRGDALISTRSGKPNAWGLVNHVGNAQEWVLTSASKLLAVGGARTDPIKECTEKTQRRHNGGADSITGFRVARSIAAGK